MWSNVEILGQNFSRPSHRKLRSGSKFTAPEEMRPVGFAFAIFIADWCFIQYF